MRGQHDVEVFLAEARVDVEVVEFDVRLRGAVRHDAIGRIAPPRIPSLPFLIEWHVAVQSDARGADERHGALGQRYSQRRPGNGPRLLATNPCLDDLATEEIQIAIRVDGHVGGPPTFTREKSWTRTMILGGPLSAV